MADIQLSKLATRCCKTGSVEDLPHLRRFIQKDKNDEILQAFINMGPLAFAVSGYEGSVFQIV